MRETPSANVRSQRLRVWRCGVAGRERTVRHALHQAHVEANLVLAQVLGVKGGAQGRKCAEGWSHWSSPLHDSPLNLEEGEADRRLPVLGTFEDEVVERVAAAERQDARQ